MARRGQCAVQQDQWNDNSAQPTAFPKQLGTDCSSSSSSSSTLSFSASDAVNIALLPFNKASK